MERFHNPIRQPRPPARQTRLPRALLFLLSLSGAVGLQAVDLNHSIPVDVPADTSLEQALIDLGKKTDVPVNFASMPVEGKKTRGLKGNFTLIAALEKLLKEAHLAYTLTIRNESVYVKFADDKATAKNLHMPKQSPSGVTHRERPRSGTSDTDMAVVTIPGVGSHIPEEDLPPGTMVLKQRDLENAGFQTVGEAIRSLTQSFPGGLNPAVVSARGNENTRSQSAASSANLHGLGSSSTLVLLNGHRLSTAETSGAVDVTLIPISAVDQIEVSTGGASAIYGSNAVAGVINIVLRHGYQGVQARAALGRPTAGGGFQQHYSVIGGHKWDDGSEVFVAFDCGRQRDIDSSQRSYVPAEIFGTTLLPDGRYCSRVLSATQALPAGAAASLVGAYTNRTASETENLTDFAPGVTTAIHSNVTQYALIGTARLPLTTDWTGTLTSSVSADNVTAPGRVMFDGLPDQIGGDKLDNRLRSVEVNVDGTLGATSPRAVKVAVGGGYDQEDFLFENLPQNAISLAQQRRIRFVYGEAIIPLLPVEISPDGRDGPSPLSLRLAEHAAWYSDAGASANPLIGLLYRPFRELRVEATWGTSYRVPTLIQQYNISQANLKFIPDPAVPSGESLTLFDFGGNARLRPEKSSALTFKLTYAPQRIPGTSLELTWFDIDDRKRIEFPTANTGNPLSDPNIGPFVVRNPSPQDIQQALSQSQFVDLTGGKYSASQAALIVDDREQNVSRRRASGFDLHAAYSRETRLGKFESFINFSYLDLYQRFTSTSPNRRLSGTAFYPPNLRTRLGVNWLDGGRYRASVFLNYTGTSKNTAMVPDQSVASWTTVDTSLTYIIPASMSRANMRLTLSAQNLLARRPPFVSFVQPGAPDINFDSTNASAVGRCLALQIILER